MKLPDAFRPMVTRMEKPQCPQISARVRRITSLTAAFFLTIGIGEIRQAETDPIDRMNRANMTMANVNKQVQALGIKLVQYGATTIPIGTPVSPTMFDTDIRIPELGRESVMTTTNPTVEESIDELILRTESFIAALERRRNSAVQVAEGNLREKRN